MYHVEQSMIYSIHLLGHSFTDFFLWTSMYVCAVVRNVRLQT